MINKLENRIPENAYGLCAGRHDLPVAGYVFGEVVDVHDFKTMQEIADNFVRETCYPKLVYGDTDIQHWFGGDVRLHVVVTGLTALTSAVMAACMWHNVKLTLWHYDRETGNYLPQQFGRWDEVREW